MEHAVDKLAPISKAQKGVIIVVGGVSGPKNIGTFTLGLDFEENMQIVKKIETSPVLKNPSIIDLLIAGADLLMTGKLKSRSLAILVNQSFPDAIRPIVGKLAEVQCELSLGSTEPTQIEDCPEIRSIDELVADGVRRKVAKPANSKFTLFLNNRDPDATVEVVIKRHGKCFRTKVRLSAKIILK